MCLFRVNKISDTSCIVEMCSLFTYFEHQTWHVYLLITSARFGYFFSLDRVLDLDQISSYFVYSNLPHFIRKSSTRNQHFLFLNRVLDIDNLHNMNSCQAIDLVYLSSFCENQTFPYIQILRALENDQLTSYFKCLMTSTILCLFFFKSNRA